MKLDHPRTFILLLVTAAIPLCGQSPLGQPPPPPTTAAQAPTRDTSYIDEQGTAHITRVIPVPEDLSPEAKRFVGRAEPDQEVPRSHEERFKAAGEDTGLNRDRLVWSRICPNSSVDETMAGVRVHVVTPDNMPVENKNKVLLNLHGGGFTFDSSSYAESIPIAAYAKVKVIAVLYRLAPRYPFPAALDDAIAVYKHLLTQYKPDQIVIYGTSAGGILTGEVAVKLKQLGLPEPAALGIFSGLGDFARNGDSVSMYTWDGLAGHLVPRPPGPHDLYYVGSADPKDPVLSPIYADLRGLPPTLFIASGRDVLLSATTNLHRAFLRAGVDARLVVFDGLPHAFWFDPGLPEAIEANHIMADFFVKQLSH